MIIKSIPSGKVTTYSAVAKALESKAYRAAGSAMRKNKDPSVPCHRVVCSDGRVGNYNRGRALKIKILEREGVRVSNGRIDLKAYSVHPLCFSAPQPASLTSRR